MNLFDYNGSPDVSQYLISWPKRLLKLHVDNLSSEPFSYWPRIERTLQKHRNCLRVLELGFLNLRDALEEQNIMDLSEFIVLEELQLCFWCQPTRLTQNEVRRILAPRLTKLNLVFSLNPDLRGPKWPELISDQALWVKGVLHFALGMGSALKAVHLLFTPWMPQPEFVDIWKKLDGIVKEFAGKGIEITYSTKIMAENQWWGLEHLSSGFRRNEQVDRW